MLRRISVLPLLLPIACLAGEVVDLAVTDFQALGVFPDQAQAVAEIIRTELVGLPGVRIIERSRLNAVLEERSLTAAGLTADEAAEVGQLTGADFVAVGSLAALGSTFTVSVRLVEVDSAEAVLGETQTVGDAGELPWVCRGLAISLAKTMGQETAEVVVPAASGGERPAAEELSFYKHGEYESPRTVFDGAETSLVVWALELERADTALLQSYPVTLEWLDPAGEVHWEEVRAAEFAAGQTELRVIGGKGYTEPGAWEPGRWTARVILDGEQVLTRTFLIE
jgi:TolB-like protein